MVQCNNINKSGALLHLLDMDHSTHVYCNEWHSGVVFNITLTEPILARTIFFDTT